MKPCPYLRWFFVMSVVAVAVIGASDVRGQTLFARPDTTPNYPSYRNIGECWSAAIRITNTYESIRDSIWRDTLSDSVRHEIASRRLLTRRPESAIDTANMCLRKFDADTATFLSPGSGALIVKILLIAHRDQDARRFAQRALDSMRKKSEKDYKTMLFKLMSEYGHARPIRYDEAKQYYVRGLTAFKGDSLYYSIDVARMMNDFSDALNDTAMRDSARRIAIRLNDATSEEERRNSPGWRSRLSDLATYVASIGQGEALDSLTISNLAYELWYANTVKRRVVGGDSVTRAEMTEKLEKGKMKIQGEHYYIATTATSPNASSHGLATYTSEGVLPKGTLPIKNTISYITAMPTLCQTQARSNEDGKSQPALGTCHSYAAHIRDIKRKFPDIEIIGLSNTYGTVGPLGPLTFDENADTLAKLFLGFHRLPARLVVENTQFYFMAEPDGRRIDIDTPNSEAFCSVKNWSCHTYADKDGYMVNPYVHNDPAWFKRFYEVLKNRPSK